MPPEVFLSYNASDRADVRAIARRLRDAGVQVWFDEWDAVPGTLAQSALVEALRAAPAVAVFIGANSGPWQRYESMIGVQDAVYADGRRVIPVLLTGAEERSLDGFEGLFTRVDFRHGADDDDALRRLIAGVRGVPPGPGLELAGPKLPTSIPHVLADARVAECLRALGVADGAASALADLMTQRAAARAGSRYRGEAEEDVQAMAEGAEATPRIRRAILRLWDELLDCVQPERVIAGAPYVSKQKIARAYRSYRAHLHDRSATDDDDVERRFFQLHRYFDEHGRLVYLPGRLLLGRPVPFDPDVMLYFRGAFVLDSFDELLAAFPRAKDESERTTRRMSLIYEIFNHPDPFLLPLLRFTGTIGDRAVSLALSRKNMPAFSGMTEALAGLLSRETMILRGFATAADTGAAQLELLPLTCDFEWYDGSDEDNW